LEFGIEEDSRYNVRSTVGLVQKLLQFGMEDFELKVIELG
jgi:hypothetical protein